MPLSCALTSWTKAPPERIPRHSLQVRVALMVTTRWALTTALAVSIQPFLLFGFFKTVTLLNDDDGVFVRS